MDNYTEAEKEYHTDIINDAIEVLEMKKQNFEIPIEEHIDLIISYNGHIDMLKGTEDVYGNDDYVKLFEQSEILVRYLAEVYHKTGELNMQTYYIFCKTIEKMTEMMSDKKDNDLINIEKIFQKLKMN